jgi:DNA-binding NtrC family response regulator
MTTEAAARNTHLDLQTNFPELEILVIEDEDLMSALILRYLESSVIPGLGVKPKIRTLDRGWDLLQADLSNVRVAVVDLLLPQVTGIDLIRNFRSRYPNMGIVPISGMATEPMRRNLVDILKGDFNLVEKPLRKENFRSAFAKAWNFWTPPGPENREWEDKEPSWNAVSADLPSHGIKVEKRKLPKRAADPNDPNSENPHDN